MQSTSVDRRTRKREARREHLLDLAADLVEALGVDGVTMAALAEAADYAPASLYTYFPSRSALLAALQNRALATLRGVAETHVEAWDAALAEADVSPAVAGLARLWAFSDLFLAAPDTHPREFRLQQDLLVTADGADTAEAATVLPAAMSVLEVPRRLLAAAEEAGALGPHPPVRDPLDDPVDGTIVRTLAWLVAMNGASLADRLTTGMPITGTALGTEVTAALLAGWGAPTDDLAAARDVATAL